MGGKSRERKQQGLVLDRNTDSGISSNSTRITADTFEFSFIGPAQYICYHNGRPASNQKAKNIFTETLESPLLRKYDYQHNSLCQCIGDRSGGVGIKIKDLYSTQIWSFSSKSTRITAAFTWLTVAQPEQLIIFG